MEIELLEIRDFLARHAPFDVLADETLDDLPRKLVIRYLRRGSHFPPDDTDGACLCIVRSGAMDLRDSNGQLLEKLGEGDVYAHDCQEPQSAGGASVTSCEDSLLYLLPCEEFEALRRTSPRFDKRFSNSLRERMEQAVDTVLGTASNGLGAMSMQVGDLLRRGPVTVDADSSIQAAAQVMASEQVSSVMVMEQGKLVGLITDSDLRKRCIATGLSIQQPVRNIMTSELETVGRTTLLSDALLAMTRFKVHHLPVKDDDTLSGIITVSDLIRHQSTHPAFIATDVRKAQSVDELVRLSTRLPELQLQLSRSSATAQHIGEAIASITDAITGRLIELAEQQLGAAPLPFVWLAGGSQGRREQTTHTDQDNALVIADEMTDAQEEYFAALSRFVCDGLDACGYVHCPGDAMASNPRWRQPLSIWRKYFEGWIERPEPKALMLSSIFFDLRPVYGDASLFDTLQQQVLSRTQDNRIFIAYMVANALTHRPPLGFFRNFVLVHDGEHDDTLDIKHRGLVPIVDVARVYALSESLSPVNTIERLQAARDCGALSDEMSDSLQDAFEFIATLRIRHQAIQIRNGEKPDNYLPPSELSQLERSQLKDAFAIIKSIQDTLENRYQAGRFA
jgi:CBS domain-containing protein